MRRRFLAGLILAVCSVLGGSVRAEWVALGADDRPAPPQVTAVRLGDALTRIEVVVPGFSREAVTVAGRSYVRLRLPRTWFSLERGAPELPLLASSLALDDAGTPTVRVLEEVWRRLPSDPVLPSKGNLPRTLDPAAVPYEFGPAYAGGGIHPAAAVELGRPYILRDLRGASLRIHPLRWDAAAGELLVLERMTLEVATAGRDGENPKRRVRPQAADRSFSEFYARQFDNLASADKYAMVTSEGRMLVVCGDAFAADVDSFVQWKRQRGLEVEVLTVSAAGGTAAGIRDAVAQRYFEPAGLTFVVLVGDVAQVPTNVGTYEGADDDTRYGNLEGDDLYPDLFVSRISAQTSDQVRIQTAKFIRYERDPEAGANWYHRAAGLASNEGVPTDWERADWLRDDLLADDFTDVDQIYAPTGTTAEVVAAVNAGRSLINYLGHGSGTSWSNPYLGSADVAGLQNGWRNPWILDVSCSNGDFSYSECFAEAWMRAGTVAQPQGAIAIYSSSTLTPWVPPCVMQAEAVDLLVSGRARLIGSLYYHGMMEVLDVYPGDEGTQLVEQYNVFGDCSLMVRTATPLPLAVQRPETVPVGALEWPVLTGIEGAVAALSRDGELLGTGTADRDGLAVVRLAQPLAAAPGLILTVTGSNLLTHVETVPVGEPLTVSVTPDSLAVGVATEVSVTVADTSGAVAGLTVTIAGFGVDAAQAVTGPDGVARIAVTPLYGETLIVSGREDGGLFDRFATALPVSGAAELTDAWFAATAPAVRKPDTLAAGLPGLVAAGALESGLSLALAGCGLDTLAAVAGDSLGIAVTPAWPGLLRATLLRPGCRVLGTDVVVVDARGSLAGLVSDAGNGGLPLSGVRIQGFAAGSSWQGSPLFDVSSGVDGVWTAPGDFAVGEMELLLTRWSYTPLPATAVLVYGANWLESGLVLAPTGAVSGRITASGTDLGLLGAVMVFLPGTGQQVAQVFSDPATGTFLLENLAFGDYTVTIEAAGYLPQTSPLTLAVAQSERFFALEPVAGNILVIEDTVTAKSAARPDRLDAAGRVTAPGYTAEPSRSALLMLGALSTLGYGVTYLPAAYTDPAAWDGYDLILVSCGDKAGTLNETLKDSLEDYVAGGGLLLIEGGDLAYDHWADPEFAQTVLHVAGWKTDEAGDVAVSSADHELMTRPNPLPPTLALDFVGYASSDVVTPDDGGTLLGSWTSSWGDASVICGEGAAPAGRTVFFAFDWAALADGVREDLLQNAVQWLIAPDTPPSDVPSIGLPATVRLGRNRPNPFNPVTRIEFELPAPQRVDLAVYDLAGRHVRSLVAGVLPAGRHEAVWDGRDGAGRTAASGLYFYRLNWPAGSLGGKMLLVK